MSPGSALAQGRWLASHTIGVLLIIAVVLTALWLAAGQSPKPPAGPPPQAGQPDSPAGSSVRDGALSFTITGYKCGVSELGSRPVNTHANGQFCLIDVMVHNHGGYPGWVFPFGQRLIDDRGNQHTASGWSWIYHKPARDLLKPLAPDASANGSLVFDLPVDARPSLLIVHDTPWSRGTPLRLPIT